MQSKATTVEQYLAGLTEDRRKVLLAVREVVLTNLDKDYEEGMQYGMIGYYVPHRVYPAGYHCDPKQPLSFAALASQKNYMSLYLMCVYGDSEHLNWFQRAWAQSGKKLDMGKSCVRFKKLDDLALDVIADAIRRVPARTFIEHYEATVKPMNNRLAKGAGEAGRVIKIAQTGEFANLSEKTFARREMTTARGAPTGTTSLVRPHRTSCKARPPSASDDLYILADAYNPEEPSVRTGVASVTRCAPGPCHYRVLEMLNARHR